MLPKLLITFIFIKSMSSIDPVVELPNGNIRGILKETYAGNKYFSYKKIPYARPPIGKLRFKAPQPTPKWNGTLDATVFDTICYQFGNKGIYAEESEDCLFLNVHTPKPPQDHLQLLPVMVYIYGGAYTFVHRYPQVPDLFIDNGVILVTISYRIGIFGFLSTEDKVIPGNNGLKDQQLAIKWVHDNIRLFGGDPNKVTIFGESAGAGSASLQLLHLQSKGYFRAAILQSGSSISGWTSQQNARKTAFGVAAVLNSTFVNSNDSHALLEFMQSVSDKDVDKAAEDYYAKVENTWDWNVNILAYAPVVEVENDDSFITEKMFKSVKNGNVLKVPTLMGINSEEGLFSSPDPKVLQKSLNAFDNDLSLIVPFDMEITDEIEKATMAEAIRNIYTNGKPFGTDLASVVKFTSDNMFNRASVKYAKLFSSQADTFFYQLSYKGTLGNWTVQYDGTDPVAHTEDLNYMFCVEGKPNCDLSDYSERDQLTSKRIITMWTNFAKYLNPTPERTELFQNVLWPKLNVQEGDFWYLDINTNLEIKNHPKEIRLKKWDALYDNLSFTDFTTY